MFIAPTLIHNLAKAAKAKQENLEVGCDQKMTLVL